MSWLSALWNWITNTGFAIVAFVFAAAYILRPIIREFASFARRRGLVERLTARLGGSTKTLRITLPDGDEVELSGFTEERMREVLDRIAPSERAGTERR